MQKQSNPIPYAIVSWKSPLTGDRIIRALKSTHEMVQRSDDFKSFEVLEYCYSDLVNSRLTEWQRIFGITEDAE